MPTSIKNERHQQPPATTQPALRPQPRATQADALGPGKVAYFNRLANKYGPTDAIAKLVKDDGSELTLAQLRKSYGPVD